jgi:hypothetical protein
MGLGDQAVFTRQGGAASVRRRGLQDKKSRQLLTGELAAAADLAERDAYSPRLSGGVKAGCYFCE